MQTDKKSMELTGDLFGEFDEVKKIVEEEDGVPYATWSKVCSSFLSIICC
ncbi:MAG: hypothetical protein HFH07_12835 [Dorea sp.]|jgi:hypothetical protein|nr:hypothetical protein [Dorea sp.]